MMTCKRIRRKLSAFLDSELTAPEAGSIEQHLARCAACRQEARALTATYQLLALCPPGAIRPTPEVSDDKDSGPALDLIGTGVWRMAPGAWRVSPLPPGSPRLALRRASLSIVAGLFTGALLGLWLWPRLSPAAAAAPAAPRLVYQRDAAAFGSLTRDPLVEVYVTLTTPPRR